MSVDTIWEEAFTAEIASIEQRTGTNPTEWRTGGRVSKANPNKEDKAWWDENGKAMFQSFVTCWQETGLSIWTTPNGTPGVELGFDVNFGKIRVKGFADLLAVNKAGELGVVDHKTGNYIPDGPMQLGLYACLNELTYGVRPTWGAYYSARKGQFIYIDNIDRWTIPLFTELFAQFQRGLDAEIFLPNVGMACGTCGVKEYCYAVGGQLSSIYDPLALLTRGEKNGK